MDTEYVQEQLAVEGLRLAAASESGWIMLVAIQRPWQPSFARGDAEGSPFKKFWVTNL